MTAILGISVGARQIGLAIIKDNELIDRKTKTFAGLRKREKIKLIVRVIKREIEAYRITHIALKESWRASDVTDQVHDELKPYEGKYGIQIGSFYEDDMRKVVVGIDRKVKKKDMLGMITHLYPCLSPLLRKEKQNLNPYYGRLFEAVAVAHQCSKEAS